MLEWLLSTEHFTPRKQCVSVSNELYTAAMASEILTGFAYVGISAMLLVLLYRRPQLLPSKTATIGFIVFIGACAAAHFIDAIIWEYPIYRVWMISRWVMGGAGLAVFFMLPLIYQEIRKYRSSAEYHDMANIAHDERLKAERLRLEAEKKAAALKYEFDRLETRIEHLAWRDETKNEAEALKLHLKRIRKAGDAA